MSLESYLIAIIIMASIFYIWWLVAEISVAYLSRVKRWEFKNCSDENQRMKAMIFQMKEEITVLKLQKGEVIHERDRIYSLYQDCKDKIDRKKG